MSLYNIDIYQGNDFAITVTAKDCAGSAMDLNEYSISGSISRYYSSSSALCNFEFSKIVPFSGGVFVASLNNITTSSLPVGQYVYSIDVVRSGSVTNILNGYTNINPRVVSYAD